MIVNFMNPPVQGFLGSEKGLHICIRWLRAGGVTSMATCPQRSKMSQAVEGPALRTVSASLAPVGPPLPQRLSPAPTTAHVGADAWPGSRVARGPDAWARLPI